MDERESVTTALGRRVLELRTRVGPQRTVAKRAGVSQTHLAKIERGEGNPTILVVEALAEALGVSLRDLLAPFSERVSERVAEYRHLPQHVAAAARQVADLPPETRKHALATLQGIVRVARAAAQEAKDPALGEVRKKRPTTVAKRRR